jgi:hypothetical protein
MLGCPGTSTLPPCLTQRVAPLIAGLRHRTPQRRCARHRGALGMALMPFSLPSIVRLSGVGRPLDFLDGGLQVASATCLRNLSWRLLGVAASK